MSETLKFFQNEVILDFLISLILLKTLIFQLSSKKLPQTVFQRKMNF